jgi:hypothetical protein
VIALLDAIPSKLRWSCAPAIYLVLFWGCSPASDAQPRANQASSKGGSSSAAGANSDGSGGATQSTAAGGSTQVAASGGSTGINTGIVVGIAGDCGHQNFQIAQKPVNVLLVLDRSASMVEDSTPTKWSIVVPTLQGVVELTNSSISWGLKVFPEGTASQCTAATAPIGVKVPIGPLKGPEVAAAIGATQPTGNGTPTATAIREAIKDLRAVASTDPKYILLATDGEPSCADPLAGSVDSTNARTQAIAAVGEALTAGFPTFVVGITTPGKTSALASLDAMADAGGKPRQDPNPLSPKYYIAATAQDLLGAMQSITSTVVTCTFPLDTTPPDKNLVNVYIGTEPVHHDTTAVDGWHYDPPTSNTIQLYGSACDKVRDVGAQSVNVVYVCPTDILY